MNAGIGEERATAGRGDSVAEGLEVNRCPRCLFDRRVQAPEDPCPECGYVTPPGTVVITVPRRQRTKTAVAWRIVFALLLAFMVFTDTRGALFGLSFFLVVLLQIICEELVRAYRIFSSADAYAAQLWLSAEGVGHVPDADPDSFGRATESVLSWLIVLLMVASLGLRERFSSAFIIFWVLFFLLLTALPWAVRWRRRRRQFRPADGVQPEARPWSRLDPILIRSLDGGVRVYAAKSHGPLTTPIFDLVLTGDDATAARLARMIRGFAGEDRVVLE